MIKQLIAQSLNGFSIKDLPFLFLQLSVSAILVLIIRSYWRKGINDPHELSFLKFLVPFHLVLTTIAVFSINSPWITILFGLLALIPVLGTQSFSLRSKAFYMISIFIAFGCGGANLIVTVLTTIVLIIPCLHFYKSEV